MCATDPKDFSRELVSMNMKIAMIDKVHYLLLYHGFNGPVCAMKGECCRARVCLAFDSCFHCCKHGCEAGRKNDKVKKSVD